MKKEYMKPNMQVVKIHRYGIICASPNGYDGKQPVEIKGGTIENENDII